MEHYKEFLQYEVPPGVTLMTKEKFYSFHGFNEVNTKI